MRISWTLFSYFGSRFGMNILMVFAGIMSLVMIVDLVETSRDVAGKEGIDFVLTVQMSLLKMPGLAQELLPFTLLLGAIWTFTRLTRSSELVVARAAGVSVWQFLAPALGIGLLIGLFVVTVFNPLSASTTSAFNVLYAKHVDGASNRVQISKSGLWLRQADGENQSVVHALEVDGENLELNEVIFILYRGADEFAGRIDAQRAVLEPGRWRLENAYVSQGNETSVFHPSYEVATSLSLSDIEDNFAKPETISFWDLPRFIALAEAAGFAADQHRLHWHSILSMPFLLCAMVLIAATFSLRLSRLGGVGQLILAGTLAGFGLYFLSDVTKALGMSGSLPIVLAAWAPTGMAMLLGTTMLLHLEDG